MKLEKKIVVGKSSRKLKMLNNELNTSAILVAIPIFNELKYLDDVLNAVRRYSDNI